MQVYAMYENGLRAKRQQSLQDNLSESARLYSRFSQVAAQNPMAWNRGEGSKQPESAETIGTITKRNRMICFPCMLFDPSVKISTFGFPIYLLFSDPLLMNAFNDVNLSAACLVTSTEYAERLGIPREKWIFPLGGGRARDSEDCKLLFFPRTTEPLLN